MWYPGRVDLLGSADDGGGGLVAVCRYVVHLLSVG